MTFPKGIVTPNTQNTAAFVRTAGTMSYSSVIKLRCLYFLRYNALRNSPCHLRYGTCLLQIQAKAGFPNKKITKDTDKRNFFTG